MTPNPFFLFIFLLYLNILQCSPFPPLSESLYQISFDQLNTISMPSEDSFPLKINIPLPQSHNININLKFKKFEYKDQILSENDFEITSYIVNETFISELEKDISLIPEDSTPIKAKYYLAETTAFFNYNTLSFPPEIQHYTYIIINKNENNTNTYNNIVLDIFCQKHNTIPQYDVPVNYYFFGSISPQDDSIENIKMIYMTNLTNFYVELIQREKRIPLEWTIETKTQNPKYANDTQLIKETSYKRGIRKVHFGSENETAQGLVTIYVTLNSNLNQSEDYMIKFEQYNEDVIVFSPDFSKTMYDDQMNITFYNLFYNNTDISSVSYVIKGYNKSRAFDETTFDSPFNFYQGEESELVPNAFLIKTEYDNNNNKERISFPLTIRISEFYTPFYFYINVIYRTQSDSIERIVMYDIYSFSTIPNEGEEIMFDQVNVFSLYEEPFNHPLFVQLPPGQNKNITYYNKFHSFEYKPTLPFDDYIVNEEIELTTTVYLVSTEYMNSFIEDPTIDLPKDGIIAKEFREEHVSMIELNDISADYMLIVMNINQSKIQLFDEIVFNVFVTEDVGKTPKWILPAGYYAVGDFTVSKRKMYTLGKEHPDDILFEIEISLNEPNPNFDFIIENYQDTPTFINDTSIIANVTDDVGKITIIVEHNKPFVVITLLDKDTSSPQSSTKYNIKYVTGENVEDLPFFYYHAKLTVEPEYERIGKQITWATKTKNLYAEYSDIVQMVNIYKYYKQSKVPNIGQIENYYLPSQNDSSTILPEITSKFEPFQAVETIIDSQLLPSEFMYISLLSKIDSIFGEQKLLYEIYGLNATVIPFEYYDFNIQTQFIYKTHFTKDSLYMYTEIPHSLKYVDICFKWGNMTYDKRNEFAEDLFDIEVYYTNLTYITARGLNDTTPLPQTKAYYGEKYWFERINYVRLERSDEDKEYDYLYMIIKQNGSNKNEYSNYTVDVSGIQNENENGIVSYKDEYYVHQLRKDNKFIYFVFEGVEKVLEMEFGVNNNNPNIDFSFECGNIPSYKNDSKFIFKENKNKIILTTNDDSDINSLSFFVFHKGEVKDLNFYFKYKTYKTESEIIEINYSNVFEFKKSSSSIIAANVLLYNKNLNIKEIVYDIKAYLANDVFNLNYLNSLYILSENEVPLYRPILTGTSYPKSDNTDPTLMFRCDIPENYTYYVVMRALGLMQSGENFKLKYNINFVNRTFIDFPMISKDNSLIKTYTNTTSSPTFTPFYFYMKQINIDHNYEVVFKYKCKYQDKQQHSNNLFRIESYAVDRIFIELRKENDTEPELTSQPQLSSSIDKENIDILKINSEYSYIKVNKDQLNPNSYDSVEFSIYIIDKDSKDNPKLILQQNEFYYGTIENADSYLYYKLNLLSKEHKYMKVEIIQNANDNDLKWEITKINNDINDNDNIIKTNTTSNGKSTIILDFNNQNEPYEALLSIHRITSNAKSYFLVKYISDVDESNFNKYSYNSSKVEASVKSETNIIEFKIPLIFSSSQQILNNVEYYLRGYNKNLTSSKDSIDTLFISNELLRDTPLYTEVIKPTSQDSNNFFDYTLNITSTINVTSYYFTLVAVVYDNEGNKIDMLGYDIVEVNIQRKKNEEHKMLVYIIIGCSIGGIIIIIFMIMYCSSRASKKHNIIINKDKDIDGIDGPIAPKEEDNELGESISNV